MRSAWKLGLFAVPLFVACARPAAPPNDPWTGGKARPRSAKTVEIGEVALGSGLAAAAFGGVSMGVGKAVGEKDPGGQLVFWVGVVTLGIGIVSTAAALVILAVAAVEHASGD